MASRIRNIFHKRNEGWGNLPVVGSNLDKQFGQFLKQRRAGDTFEVFAKKIGVSVSTLYRLEAGQQSVTLRKLEEILRRLKIKVGDIFS